MDERTTYELRLIDERREKIRQKKEDARSIKHHARDNAKGKLKIRSKTSGGMGKALNHRAPKGNTFIKRGNRVENPMASFGYTQEQTDIFLATGKTKAQQESEGN